MDIGAMLAEREQRGEMLTNQLEAMKAEANRVIGECQGQIKENDTVLEWLRGLKATEDQEAAAAVENARTAQLQAEAMAAEAQAAATSNGHEPEGVSEGLYEMALADEPTDPRYEPVGAV